MHDLSPYFIRRTDPASEGKPVVLLNDPVGEERSEVGFGDFWDFWRILKKRRGLIVTVFLAVVIGVAGVTYMIPPTYTSEATILIEQKEPQVLDIQQVLPGSPGFGQHDFYATQYELLKSPSLAVQVIRELDLENNKVFTGEEKKGLAAELKSWVKQWVDTPEWIKSLRANADELAQDPATMETRLTNTYVHNYMAIEPVAKTRLVKVAFNTRDPDLSAELANAHVRTYLRQGVKFRATANEEAQKFLEQRLVELKNRVDKSEALLKKYRNDTGIISLNDRDNVVVERLGDLNKRLTEAEAERLSLEAQVRLIRQRTFDSIPAVINSSFIQTLKAQTSGLEGEYAKLSAEFNLSYPPLAQLNAQLEETRKRLRKEIQSVVEGVESAYLAAETRERGLREKFREQRSAALKHKDASVEYAILSREAETNRQLYDNVFKRMKEMGVAAELRTSNIYVVDEAKPPLDPSRPKTAPYLLFGVFFAAVAGVALAFLLEYLDKSVKTPDEVERYVNLPTLAVVPDLAMREKEPQTFNFNLLARRAIFGSANGNKPPTKSFVLSHPPLSLVTESYRYLQTSILLSQAEEPPRTVLFSSGCQAEGKTATAINTAIIFAQMEARVLVIDADLRRSSCHEILGLQRKPGLTELLTGQRVLDEVVTATMTDNLFLIPSGSTPPDPVKLVGSRKMHEILIRLREQFDYIFIDSPPLIAVSDAVRLSAMVDGVVLVVKGQATTRDVLQEACSRLRYARAKILGVVLNKIDMKNGDYDYYHREFYRTPTVPEVTV